VQFRNTTADIAVDDDGDDLPEGAERLPDDWTPDQG
jgi:hypothetical protein